MSDERRRRILAQLSGGGGSDATAVRLCEVCRSVTGVTGAGIMLMSGELRLGSACTTNEVSGLIEDLQYMLGEGPCLDAYHLDRPVSEPDLADPAEPRWLAFTGVAVEAGVRAIFGFPMAVGELRMGALNLYADRPGPLSDDQHADALVMADLAAEAVLAMQAEAPAGVLAAKLERASNFQYVVHQAAGWWRPSSTSVFPRRWFGSGPMPSAMSAGWRRLPPTLSPAAFASPTGTTRGDELRSENPGRSARHAP